VDSAYVETETYPVFENCENTIQNYACDFSAINEFSQETNLYDFYSRPIVLDLSAMWCPPCQAAAAEVEELAKLYEDEDLIYLTVLIENKQGLPPTEEDIKWWLEEWGIIEQPVLGSNRGLIDNNDAEKGWLLQGWPTFYFIDEEMKIQGYMNGYSRNGVIDGINFITEKSK
tara:strand:- start:2056 stop:2571 length:516 start_codon:yes stop_codon:yes gene_type:complete